MKSFFSYFRRQPSNFLYPAAFLAVAVAWTWPLVTRLSWRIPHDPGDPILNTWILWWNTQAIPFTDAWWSPPIFYPMPAALALSEHLAGIAIFTAPLQLAGLPPLAAYNVALILSAWLSAVFAFLLGRRLTGSTFAGFVAGVAFAFAPYRASQLSHLQVLTAQWMPLALLGMHAYLEEGRARWLVLFAAAWLLQALSNGYYLLFLPILIALWLLWFVDWRTQWRRGAALVATFAAASLLLVPVLLQYRHVHETLGLQRTIHEMRQFSAQLTSLVQPAYLLTFWPSRSVETQEAFLFPGVTVVVLVLAGGFAARRDLQGAINRRSAGLFYALGAVFLTWLCFGPADEPSLTASLQYPYSFLTLLPGFEGLRVPARFGMLATLCIAVAAAIAAARLAPRRKLLRVIAGAVVALGLFIDGWIDTMPLSAPPGRAFMSAPQDSVVIELPLADAVSTAAMYRAIAHRRPLVNGYSGHTPAHYELLSWSLEQGDPTPLQHFARGRPLVVVVHRAHDPDERWRRLVREAGGVLREETGVGPVFLVPPQPALRTPALGPRLASGVDEETDPARVDLGSEQLVRAITVPLRKSFSELSPRLAVEISLDGISWRQAWSGWTGEAALIGALEDARDVPMTLVLPDVHARYIRLNPSPAWIARELSVFGVR